MHVILASKNDSKLEGIKMKIGDYAFVDYATGESFHGEVVQVKNMPGDRVLFTLKIEGVGFRAMYIDKCISLDYSSGIEA